MITVELKSLLPEFEEILHAPAAAENASELSAGRTAPAGVSTADFQQSFYRGEPVEAVTLPGGDRITALLEQLVGSSERNAASTEKVADLLESQESQQQNIYS